MIGMDHVFIAIISYSVFDISVTLLQYSLIIFFNFCLLYFTYLYGRLWYNSLILVFVDNSVFSAEWLASFQCDSDTYVQTYAYSNIAAETLK